MLIDTRITDIRISGVMVMETWKISFSAEIGLVSVDLRLTEVLHRDAGDMKIRDIIGPEVLYLNITDQTPGQTIETYLQPLNKTHPGLVQDLVGVIEEHVTYLRAKAENAMKGGQKELELDDLMDQMFPNDQDDE